MVHERKHFQILDENVQLGPGQSVRHTVPFPKFSGAESLVCASAVLKNYTLQKQK